MNQDRQTPWAGMALALMTVIGLVMGHVGLVPIALVALIWFFSLWVDWLRPGPEVAHPAPPERPDFDGMTRDAMRRMIEPLNLPLLLFDDHRAVAANAMARDALGAYVAGQDARIALRHPDAVRLLDQGDGASVTVRGLTGPRSLWQLTRQRIDPRYWFIEMTDRTAESDLSRAQTDFVANASHELRTPLAAIIGYIETLSDAPDSIDKATTAQFHATVLREARRMQGLVADLISLSKLEAEKHDRPSEMLDLAALAKRVVAEVTVIVGKGRVMLQMPKSSVMITGDAFQLEQLLRNLIDNAIKYGDPAKPLAVTVTQGAMAELSVQDHGPGIAAEHLPHLTRRFYRTDPGRSRGAGGTGLGLAIVKHIVERHRGELDISSVLGDGTMVTVFLPAENSAKAFSSQAETPDNAEKLEKI